jgi:hypothetical protein
MKSIALVSLLGLTVANATLAHADTFATAPAARGTPESLFQSGRRPDAKIGWYVAPTSGFTSLAGSRAYTVGLRAALVLNRSYGFGLAGHFIGNDQTRFHENDARAFGGYGGAYFQYILKSNGLVHGFADVTAGAGGWCGVLTNDDCQSSRQFAFIEPTVNAELNIVQNVRLTGRRGLPRGLGRGRAGPQQPATVGAGRAHRPGLRDVLANACGKSPQERVRP